MIVSAGASVSESFSLGQAAEIAIPTPDAAVPSKKKMTTKKKKFFAPAFSPIWAQETRFLQVGSIIDRKDLLFYLLQAGSYSL